MLHLVAGGLLLALSLLAVFYPPHSVFWLLSIPVKEWGYLFALAALPLLWPTWLHGWADYVGAGCALVATTLFLLPLIRAVALARRLPHDWAPEFDGASEAGDRPAPFRWRDLVLGVRTPRAPMETLAYVVRDGQPLLLDFYRTEQPKAPVVLVIHGGSWRSGDRKQLSRLNHYLASRGFAVASMQYRLLPDNRFPAMLADVEAAIDYLKADAAKLGVDPTRIALLGRSAGGHLAIVAAYTRIDPSIRGAISFYGPFDLAWGFSEPGWILDSRAILGGFLGGTPDEVPDQYRAACPMELVGPNTPPTLLIQGEADALVSPLHSVKLVKRLTEEGRPHQAVFVPFSTHGSDFHFSGPFGQISTYAVERFLRSVFATAPSTGAAARSNA